MPTLYEDLVAANQEISNLQEANDFVAERLPDMAGTLEIVCATLCRQRVV